MKNITNVANSFEKVLTFSFELIALFGAILIVSFSTIFKSTYVLYALTNAQTPWIMVLCMVFGIVAGASTGSFIGSHFEPVEDFCEGLAYELVRFGSKVAKPVAAFAVIGSVLFAGYFVIGNMTVSSETVVSEEYSIFVEGNEYIELAANHDELKAAIMEDTTMLKECHDGVVYQIENSDRLIGYLQMNDGHVWMSVNK